MSVTSLRSEHGRLAAASAVRRARCGARSTRLASAVLPPAVDVVALVAAAAAAGVPLLSALFYGTAVLCLLSGQGLHRLRISLRVWDQVPRMAIAAMAAVVVVLLWTPPAVTLLLGAFSTGALVLARSAACALLRTCHRRGLLREPTLVVGGGETAELLAETAGDHPEFGLRVVGFAGGRSARFPLLGDVAELPRMIADHGITRVLICSSDDAELVTRVRALRTDGVDICVVPTLPELGMAVPRGCLDELWGIPLIPLRRPNPLALAGKRAFDVVAGGLVAVAVAPLLLVFACLPRCGGALFRQWRVTRTGRTSRVVKLRTLVDPAESWSVAPEQCTALGRWLRGTHLDELPQLANVLRGDMSLVGPRPERPCYAERFAERIPHYADRHRMTGGMTGWAQVHGLHGDTSIPERARFDNQYIEYWSLWTDLVIVARTAAIVTRAMGGRR